MASTMRVLGIETSSPRGTVALVVDGRIEVELEHDGSAHAEHLLSLVDRALAEGGVARTALDRIAVGVGPGSFTGLRVGIAFARGVALGLGCPVVGVGSLRAMCGAVPAGVPGVRVGVLDARRAELFLAAYTPESDELAAPRAVRADRAAGFVEGLGTGPVVVIGSAALGVVPDHVRFHSPQTDLPSAGHVALIASGMQPSAAPADPLYVRDADAIRPNLPRSPLSSREPT
jgi:tRNA threonylcarbamoyl adenosine modification protein YeaZ